MSFTLPYRRAAPRPLTAASGYRGVIYQKHNPPLKKPYKAYIRHNGQYIGLGYYATKREAAVAFNEASRRYHGPDAYQNPV